MRHAKLGLATRRNTRSVWYNLRSPKQGKRVKVYQGSWLPPPLDDRAGSGGSDPDGDM